MLLAGVLGFAMPAFAAPFQLALTDGSGWVRPGQDQRPSLFLFWDESCPQCVAELAALGALLANNQALMIAAVYVGPRQTARRAFDKQHLPPAVIKTLAPSDPRGFLAGLGNRRGALPFAVMFDAAGRSCATTFGAVTETGLAAMKRRCGGGPN